MPLVGTQARDTFIHTQMPIQVFVAARLVIAQNTNSPNVQPLRDG